MVRKYAGVTVVAVAFAVTAVYLVALDRRQRAMLEELRAISTALKTSPRPAQGQPAAAEGTPKTSFPANLSLTVDPGAVKGRPDAKLTIVEFSDFECPFCGRYIRDTYHQIERAYVDTGKARYAFRHYPIERLHPNAMKAGEAAECARQQGKFWPMHDHLFGNQKALRVPDLLAAGRSIGLNGDAFQRCLGGQATAKMRQDLDIGARSGVTGTPAFFIGETQKDGGVRVLRKLTGAQSFEAFRTVLDSLLAGS